MLGGVEEQVEERRQRECAECVERRRADGCISCRFHAASTFSAESERARERERASERERRVKSDVCVSHAVAERADGSLRPPGPRTIGANAASVAITMTTTITSQLSPVLVATMPA